jgi:hypothetical protein
LVTIKLIELTDDRVIYEYFPEDNQKHPGKVALDLKTKERLFLKDSTEDFGKRYAAHAIKRIEEYASKKDFKDNDLVAWY